MIYKIRKEPDTVTITEHQIKLVISEWNKKIRKINYALYFLYLLIGLGLFFWIDINWVKWGLFILQGILILINILLPKIQAPKQITWTKETIEFSQTRILNPPLQREKIVSVRSYEIASNSFGVLVEYGSAREQIELFKNIRHQDAEQVVKWINDKISS